MASSEGKFIRFSRSGAVDWELKKKYFSVKSSRLKALKKWEHSRYYPPKGVQERINKLLLINHSRHNGNGGKKVHEVQEKSGSEIEPVASSSCDTGDNLTKGLIIRIRMKSPADKVMDETGVRKTIREIGDSSNVKIAYIDMKDTSETVFNDDGSIERTCFVRLESSEDASILVDKLVSEEITGARVIEGEDEIRYWNKMKECQENQKSKKRRKR